MNTNRASRSRKVVIHPYLAFVRLHLEYRTFWWHINKKKQFFPPRVIMNWNRVQRGCEISVLKDTENLNGHGSEQPSLTVKLMMFC